MVYLNGLRRKLMHRCHRSYCTKSFLMCTAFYQTNDLLFLCMLWASEPVVIVFYMVTIMPYRRKIKRRRKPNKQQWQGSQIHLMAQICGRLIMMTSLHLAGPKLSLHPKSFCLYSVTNLQEVGHSRLSPTPVLGLCLGPSELLRRT